MNITIFGTGYVGLVTGACLADVGNTVLCVDVDQGKIDRLKRGEVPFYEPGLEELLQHNIEADRLRFTTDAKEGVLHGLVQFIAVGTPSLDDGSADLRHVFVVAQNIASYMDDYRVICTKSTVPVGTADAVSALVQKTLQDRQANIPFDVVSNPEFLKEGQAVGDFMRPDRIIIGGADEKAIGILQKVYAPFQRKHERILVMDIRSAELTKYAANAMLATRISFMNELANLAEKLGADIEWVRKGIGSDPRIGYDFLYAGCGFGGSCFPKDLRALSQMGKHNDLPLPLLQAVQEVNARQKTILFQKIKAHFGDLWGKKFALWGLAFKPNTDDMREAPSRVLLELLWQHGASVCAYDPAAMTEARNIYGDREDFKLAESPLQALDEADGLIVVTEWKEFRSPPFEAMKARLKCAVIFDGRNIYDPQTVKSYGFFYYGIGRGQVA